MESDEPGDKLISWRELWGCLVVPAGLALVMLALVCVAVALMDGCR